MSTYYDLKTNITIEDIKRSKFLSIEDGDGDSIYIRDKYKNILLLHVGEDDVVSRVTRYGGNNPTIILHVLEKEFGVQFMCEQTWLGLVHDYLSKNEIPKDRAIELDTAPVFDSYTREFRDYVDKTGFEGDCIVHLIRKCSFDYKQVQNSIGDRIPTKEDCDKLNKIKRRLITRPKKLLDKSTEKVVIGHCDLKREFYDRGYENYDDLPF